MGAEKKTNQHVVPRFYLRFFSEDEAQRKPQIFVYDKKEDNFFSNSIDNVGYIKDFYTLPDAKDIYAWDNIYTYYIEPQMSSLLRQIMITGVSMVINNEAEIITKQQKVEMAFFVAAQVTRGKKFIDFADAAYEVPSELIRKLTGVIVDDDVSNKKTDIANLSVSKSLLSQCMFHIHNRSWMFYYSKEDAFITSDEPVVFFNTTSDRQGLFECGISDNNTVICLPLNPKLLLVMYHPSFQSGRANSYDRKRVILNIDDLIEKHNTGQISQANRFVYGNTEDIIRQYRNVKDLK